jgi:hypothetical protein
MEESIKARFFGRKNLLEDVVQGVLAPSQPLVFSLVGPTMIGKSRLLKHLASAEGPLLGPDPYQWRPERFRDGENIIVALYDCAWPEAQENLSQSINRHLRLQLEPEKRLELDWSRVERFGSPGQQISQIVEQLNRQYKRLVLILDNFGHVIRNDHITPDMVNELRPLAGELGLIVATREPMHDLNQTLAASPLFNLMHQHFVGLLEPQTAEEWVAAYGERVKWEYPVSETLLEMAGGHPFLLARINDTLMEVQPLLSGDMPLSADHLSLVKLRLAEHGRPLFEMLWRKLQGSPIKSTMPLVEQLVYTPIDIDQTASEQATALNWLINYAAVTFTNNKYHLFSPLFQEFLAKQLELEYQLPVNVWPAMALLESVACPADIFASLTPIEAELLRYFQAHRNTVVSTEQLLADVWNQPDASPRRVQEAIRRLRNSLSGQKQPVGIIENERGFGYRFVPAAGAAFE